MEHTKLPWYYGRNSREIFADGKTICRIAPGMLVGFHAPAEEEQEANAAFIVRACNAHDDVLEACKALLVVLDAGEKPRRLDSALTWRQNDELAQNMARQAIAKADGGES